MSQRTDADAVQRLVIRWTSHDVTFWIGGGWGVDALMGHQTRTHADLDVMLLAEELQGVLNDLFAEGFVIETDWLPVRVQLAHPDGTRVDLHPLTLCSDGSATQPGLDGQVFTYPPSAFASGTIGELHVRCLSMGQQLAFHSGYELRPQDRHDIDVLNSLDAR